MHSVQPSTRRVPGRCRAVCLCSPWRITAARPAKVTCGNPSDRHRCSGCVSWLHGGRVLAWRVTRSANTRERSSRKCANEVRSLFRRHRPVLIAIDAVTLDFASGPQQLDELIARVPRQRSLVAALRTFGREQWRIGHWRTRDGVIGSRGVPSNRAGAPPPETSPASRRRRHTG
jgi:hypothetical protein